uniref:Uncharacterized protein n=1 Tax=Dictyoglomus turgidum TaxID=513050 RepID=A0A7C3WMD0_9BACT
MLIVMVMILISCNKRNIYTCKERCEKNLFVADVKSCIKKCLPKKDERWIYVLGAEGIEYWMDTKSIKKLNEDIWQCWVFAEVKPGGWGHEKTVEFLKKLGVSEEEAKTVRQVFRLWEINFRKKEYSIIQTSMYDEKGNIVYSFDPSLLRAFVGLPISKPITPNSDDEAMAETVELWR